MSDLEKEKAIINESPDFENQREILNEEKITQRKSRKFYTRLGIVFFLAFLIIFIAYVTIDIYKEYNFFSNNVCFNVNIDNENVDFKQINISDGDTCIPKYNIDYLNNRKATFNIDLFGDKSKMYNATNQKAEDGSCKLNCDSNEDGWPDYNVDLNGDGTADINIVKDFVSGVCVLNCDLNSDTIPDTNIDTNNDGIADINITDAIDSAKPLYNVDYKGNRIATFNVKQEDGSVINPVTALATNSECTENCDIDNDGWPDYNIRLLDSDVLLNELITKGTNSIKYDKAKKVDWKCFISNSLNTCDTKNLTLNNEYINIDITGDGFANINISSDGGATLSNPLNAPGTYNDNSITLNEDYDEDGFPEYNIDLNSDGIPDLNITDKDSNQCTKNCDTNLDGKADYLIDYSGVYLIGVSNNNIDLDFDGTCDINCDTNYDLYPDINIDSNNDGIPDVNVDTDSDKVADINIDTDNDHKADTNLSARLDGTCNFNCSERLETIVDSTESCMVNCDTDNDGWPDRNVDLDYDGICDINCDDDESTIDNNHDYFIDTEPKIKNITFDSNSKDTFYILNPIEIQTPEFEGNWNDTNILEVVNNTNHAVSYKIEWTEVSNNYSEAGNLYYNILKNGRPFLMDLRAPYENSAISEEIYIRPKAKVRYVLNISSPFIDSQSEDSTKQYKGNLIVTTKK